MPPKLISKGQRSRRHKSQSIIYFDSNIQNEIKLKSQHDLLWAKWKWQGSNDCYIMLQTWLEFPIYNRFAQNGIILVDSFLVGSSSMYPILRNGVIDTLIVIIGSNGFAQNGIIPIDCFLVRSSRCIPFLGMELLIHSSSSLIRTPDHIFFLETGARPLPLRTPDHIAPPSERCTEVV
jgi:hypothetical protein